MIYSMTAFGRSHLKSEWGSASWELRSINHRYFEATVRLPEALRDLEQAVRETLQDSLHRGKIECVLHFQSGTRLKSLLTVNNHLLDQLMDLATKVNMRLPQNHSNIEVTHLLAWNGVITEEPLDLSAIKEQLIELLKQAVEDLKEGRLREGKKLTKGIQERLNKISAQVEVVKQCLPKVVERQKEKLLFRLSEVQSSLDPQRLEQEMVFYTQKVDVSEEIERMLAHITEVKRTLTKSDSVGKRLDFMMQELNREANTIASKSLEATMTHAAVEMKVLIEQIREQVQNIE